MHSRIYQIMSTPIPEGDLLYESDFDEHWFVGGIADYVAGNLDRVSEIKYLQESLEKRKIASFDSPSSFSILPGGKENYFAAAYE